MIEWNEISSKSFGGTEQQGRRLEKSLPKELLKNFQIILSRVRDLDEDRIRVLYLHDLPNDPESHHLKDEGWKRFHKIIFVSYWQRDAYIREYNIPYSRVSVIKNAIEPIDEVEKPTDKIRFIYHTTPHRGLELLVPVFERLAKEHDNIHLDVYSSFGIYGWTQRDEPYEPLFEKIKEHSHMTYHGYQPNDVVRKALGEAHVFAYPSIWQETSCLSLIEAMSAKCICVHPDYGALPETAAGWSMMYEYHEDPNTHASKFYNTLLGVIGTMEKSKDGLETRVKGQKGYCDLFFNWELRKPEWEMQLTSLLDLPRQIEQPEGPFFTYSVG